jgi:membrane protein DedA with SNARE-associated domain
MIEQGQIGIIVFVIMALLSAILFHYKWDSYLISSALAAVVASLLYQVVGYFILGYLDPFFMIAFTISLAVSFTISLIVGLPFAINRKRRKSAR